MQHKLAADRPSAGCTCMCDAWGVKHTLKILLMGWEQHADSLYGYEQGGGKGKLNEKSG